MKKISVLLACIISALTVFALCACSDTVEPQRFTVTFNSHGGTAVASVVVAVGDRVPKPADPKRADSVFDAWYKEVDIGGGKTTMVKYDFNSRMNAEDLTLHALWIGNKQVRIDYDANGGEFVGGDYYQLGYVGAEFYEPDTNPTRTGYIFGGWYADKECTAAYNFTVYPENNIVLYAKWNTDPNYAYITFYGNNRALTVLPVKKGDPIVAPEVFDDELKATLVVGDWCSDATLRTKYRFGRASDNLSLYMAYYTKGLTFNGASVTGYNGDAENVYVPNIYNNKEITTVGEYAFYRSSELGKIKEIILPDTITTVSEGAFYDCRWLSSVNLTDKVTAIGDNAFGKNVRLRSVGDISAVTSIGEAAFVGCEMLDDFVIPEGLTEIGAYAFADCNRLTDIIIPAGVTSVPEYAFSGCKILNSVVLKSGSLSSIGAYAFGDCPVLQSVTIERTSGAAAFEANPFSNSPEVTIYVPSSLLETYKNNTTDISIKDKLAAIR